MIELSSDALSQQRRPAMLAGRHCIARIRQDLLSRWAVLRRGQAPCSICGHVVQELGVHDLDRILAAARRLGGRYGSIDSALLETATTSKRLRLGELLALRWGDIDWIAGTVNVERVLRGTEVGPPKCGTARKVRLAPHTRRSLCQYRASLDRSEAGDLVFPDPRERGSLDARGLRQRLRTAQEHAGLPPIPIARLPFAFRAPWWSRYL